MGVGRDGSGVGDVALFVFAQGLMRTTVPHQFHIGQGVDGDAGAVAFFDKDDVDLGEVVGFDVPGRIGRP